jgi:amphi-Trp domain-containing protein
MLPDVVGGGMPEEVLFESESRRSRAEIASYLRTVADRLDGDGELSLSAGGEPLALSVPESLTFEVKAEREGTAPNTELSVEFELEWDEAGGSGDGGSGDLVIE